MSTRKPEPPMVYVHERIRWEYKRMSHELSQGEPPGPEQLDKLGTNGWELAGIGHDKDRIHFYFKRPR